MERISEKQTQIENNVDTLFESWSEKQHNFEQNIRLLMEQSKSLTPQVMANGNLREQQKLNELMKRLNEELQWRQNVANRRLQECRKSLDEMCSKIKQISKTLANVGLINMQAIDELCGKPDITEAHYELVCQQLERCEELRRTHLVQLLRYLTSEISKWSELSLQYSTLPKLKKQQCTQEYLEKLEQDLIDLQYYYNCNEPIFDLYAKRSKLWARMLEIEQKANEPDRLKNRGGQLLREEQERNHIVAELPKIEEELGQLLDEYKLRTQKSFLVFGMDMRSRLAEDWNERLAKARLQIPVRRANSDMADDSVSKDSSANSPAYRLTSPRSISSPRDSGRTLKPKEEKIRNKK